MRDWKGLWKSRKPLTIRSQYLNGRNVRLLRCEALESRLFLTGYHIDAVNGNDSNPVAADEPWRTYWNIVSHYSTSEGGAWDVPSDSRVRLESGDEVRVAPGNYGDTDQYESNLLWHNPNLAEDVNDDGLVSPIDALLVVNHMNRAGSGPVPLSPESPPLYLDVNGDDYVSPHDALLVVNHLNSQELSLSSVLTPFDANTQDLVGPTAWRSRYGKSPEIVVSSDGSELDVLVQDYDAETPWDAVLLHISPNSSGYKITQILTNIPMLDRVMGLATDDAGNCYYATGVDEASEVDSAYPPLDTYRSDIVRIIKLDPKGNVLFNINLDTARHTEQENAEMIINPMVAATSRLAVGGGEIALVHGINTDPDWNIGGARHQKALSTRLDAASGDVTRVSSIWVSHSFDQRLFYDGDEIIEYHLGDAYPRSLVLGRGHRPYPVFHIKGELGENNTRTRLGDVALIENDPEFGHLVLFATESSPDTGSTINGPRNLGIVRVHRGDSSVDPNLPDSLVVSSKGTEHTNRLRWLTDYSAASGLHAERPKLVGIGEGKYIVLWEEWLVTGSSSNTFRGVLGMVIDDMGNQLQPPTFITNEHHLHRGDDAFLLDNGVAWMTGSAADQELHLHMVDASLNYRMVTFD